MRNLLIVLIAVLSSACASANKVLPVLTLPTHKLVGTYDIVSADLMVLGQLGTWSFVGAWAVFDSDYYKMKYPSLVTGEDILDMGPLSVNDNKVTLFSRDGQRGRVQGTFRIENRSEGVYLVINFSTTSEDMTYEEKELNRLKSFTEFDVSSQVKYQEEKIAKLKTGFDWVFKRR